MRIKKLNKMEQIIKGQVGDIIPMLDESSYIDGRFEGMITDINKDTMIFLGRSTYDNSGPWFRYLIPDVTKNGFINTENGRYSFDGMKNADIESVKENDSENRLLIKKYKEATK